MPIGLHVIVFIHFIKLNNILYKPKLISMHVVGVELERKPTRSQYFRHATLPVSDTDFGGFLSDTAVLHFGTDFS